MMILFNIVIVNLSFSLILGWLYLKITKKINIIKLTPEELILYTNYIQITLIITVIILSSLIIFWLYTLKKQKKETNQKSNFTEIITKITMQYNYWKTKLNIFYKTYEILFTYYGEFAMPLVTLAKICLGFSKRLNYSIILIFTSLPRLLIIITLFIEIYFGQIHYYFYTLLLLLIPLVFRLILFLLTDIGPRALVEIKPMLIGNNLETEKIVEIQTANGIEKGKPLYFKLAPGYEDLDLNKLVYDLYFPLCFIHTHMNLEINPLYQKINKINLIIYNILQGIAFMYILSLIYL